MRNADKGELSKGTQSKKLVQHGIAGTISIQTANELEKVDDHHELTSEGDRSNSNITDKNTIKTGKGNKGKSNISKPNSFSINRKTNTQWKDYFNNKIAGPDKRLTK